MGAFAPGWPGVEPRWTSSDKSGVGTSVSQTGRVWFTLSHGILNEVYYPRIDHACIRDMGLLVTDGKGYLFEEKRDARHGIAPLAEGVAAFRLTNTCPKGRVRIVKEIIADPRRDVVLQRIQFTALSGALEDYHLVSLLAPHLGNAGWGNTAWVGDHKAVPMLMAEGHGVALAVACSTPWAHRSVGFVGISDGWHDLARNNRPTWCYERAENGNVALTGEIDLVASGGSVVIALGFGSTCSEAGHRAAASLWDGFDALSEQTCHEWRDWQQTLEPLDRSGPSDLYRMSTAILRTHESARFPGGIVASLSIPWGFAKGDNDLGGYHLVWPRDLVESAGGLLAAGARDDASRVLRYLAVTQDSDGHWPQNMWLDGSPYWDGVQMDETGFPVLLVDLAKREGLLEGAELSQFWPMVRRAAQFLVKNGPVTQQDRWEEDPGYSPFTIAVEVAALVCAADLADEFEPSIAAYLRETADAWCASIEAWTYVTDTELARDVGVDGYYVRIAPPEAADAASPTTGFVQIKNRPLGNSRVPAAAIVSVDALALVRFGLRSALDPRVVNTVKVIDALLGVDTPHGPLWRRYNEDGYGEHADGSPFDGTGIGRAWPLLAGERAHYELAAGRPDAAERLRVSLASFASEGGLLPEQVWDAQDIPDLELFAGRPSGSAMPLVWAHAEYIKLCRSVRDGRVFDTPPQTMARYRAGDLESRYVPWRFNHKCRSMPAGKRLRLEVLSPAIVHWSADDWRTVSDTETRDTGLGLHVADLVPPESRSTTEICFTFYWRLAACWERRDFAVTIIPSPQTGANP